jgi:hypothetical protein
VFPHGKHGAGCRAFLQRLCEHWDWRQANDALRDMVCRSLLLALHRAGHIVLPAVRACPPNNAIARRRPSPVAVDRTPLAEWLDALGVIAYQSRFLILPWVRVPISPRISSAASRGGLHTDWQFCHGHPAHDLETFSAAKPWPVPHLPHSSIFLQQSVSAVRRLSRPTVMCSEGRFLAPHWTDTLTMLDHFPYPRCLVLLALLTCTISFTTPASAADGPAGRIGRIAWLSEKGNVQIDNLASGESFSAPINQPLTSGDVLTTEAGTRAEIQIGSITVRLDGGSRLTLDRIDDDQVALFLNEGRAITRLSSPDTLRDFTLETRSGRFSARETGVFRFDASDSFSSVTVYAGTLHMQTDEGSTDLGSGKRAVFNGPPPARYRLAGAFSDNFSQWSASRDQRSSAPTYTRYVSPEMTGAEDLDAHGNWSETSEYGAVWYPRAVAADWAPFRSGRWVWVAPWGWNWVGNEPWGFAPFHYGRWVHHHGRWGWVPGVRIARPVYAPAMVAWVGGANFGISISAGSAPRVGWFPLGPREVYVPAYHCGTNYLRNVNVTHVKNITNITHIVNKPQEVVQNTRYMHRNAPHAVTVVAADVVTQRRPVAAANIAYREHRGLRDKPVHAGAPLAEPTKDAREARHSRAGVSDNTARRDADRDSRKRFPHKHEGEVERERKHDSPQIARAERREPARRGNARGADASTRTETRNPVTPPQDSTGTTRQPDSRDSKGAKESREPFRRDASRSAHEKTSATPIVTDRHEASRAVPDTMHTPAPRVTEVIPRRHGRPHPEIASPTDPVVRERPSRRQEAIPQAPVAAMQRIERPAMQPRPEPAAMPMPQPLEIRGEPVQQRPMPPVSAPVREAKHESPRAMQRSPEPRPEARQETRAPRHENRQRPAQQEDSPRKGRHGEHEKR